MCPKKSRVQEKKKKTLTKKSLEPIPNFFFCSLFLLLHAAGKQEISTTVSKSCPESFYS